jgi:endonuclease/exonuclease/phosphatase family metal-dependent hydrolase
MNSILIDKIPTTEKPIPGFAGEVTSTALAKHQETRTTVKSRYKWIIRCLTYFACGSCLLTFYLGNQIQPTQLVNNANDPIVLAARASLPQKIRIGTFNVHALRGRDGVSRPELVAQMLQAAKCDLVFVQEIRCPWIEGNVPQTQQLAELLNENYAGEFESQFLPTEQMWFHPYFGSGLLSRIKASIKNITPLPNTRGKGYRQMIEIDVPIQEQTLHLLCTHLDTNQDHDVQLKLLLEKFDSMPEPKILLGDLNSTQTDPLLKSLLQETHYTMKRDWIIPRGINSSQTTIEENDLASDHPLLVVEASALED